MAAREAAPEELIDRFRELHADLERIEDPRARAGCEELIAVVLDLYGEGLRRIFAALEDGGEPAAGLREQLADDGVVASLMLIHDLYPVPLAERVGEALDSVRPYMESHGGDVELLAVEDGIARIRLSGSCDGCPASASTLELAIKQALDARAPDLEALEVEGGVASPGIDAAADGMELPVVQTPAANGAVAGPVSADAAAGEAPIGLPSWFGIDGVAGLEDGELTSTAAAGLPLVVANVDGKLLAYRDACAECGGPLERGVLADGVLACPGCSRRYYLPRAGRSLDDQRLQLEPVPLLRENGAVRVADAT
jgi:Fe-S cluster biogenesis protein NfuA/nitrite reductase/ring-hydroxylating ferredoxin subunit